MLLAFQSFILPVSPAVLTGHSSPSLPSGRGVPPRMFRGEGAPPLAVVWVVLGLLPWAVCSGTSLCHPKDKSKAFLAHLGNPELLQSTRCQLVMRAQEVSLAAGRGEAVWILVSCCRFLELRGAAVTAGMHLMWGTPML